MDFPCLSAPKKIGAMTLRNRMVMSPMTTAYCNADQTPSERLMRFFEARAEGGVGLIITELVTTDVVHRYMHRSMTLGEDRYIPFHEQLTSRVHSYGAKVIPQLSHTGPESVAPMFGGPQPLGPSVSVAPVWGWASRELGTEELPAIIQQYADAAYRAQQAGYDGIELHAAHCYNLLGSFLSPQRNKRTDDYSAFRAETRTRLIAEVLGAIKLRTGSDFPVVLSISGFERVPGGRAIDDTQRLAPELVAAGVDAFRVSGGISDSLVTMMVGRSELGDAHNIAQAEAIKHVVDVPVIVVGRLHDPEVAEQVLADGRADLVAMARPLLADPELPNKISTGRVKQLRRCISCQHCIDSMQMHDNLACAVNPFAGREYELQLQRGTKKLAIIGGGTAGLQAACLAADQGHQVVLFEQHKRLGGSLNLAATVHSDNERLLSWLLDEVRRLKIELRLGVRAGPIEVQKEQADAVLVATGAGLRTPDIPGMDQAHVLTGSSLRQMLGFATGSAEQSVQLRWPLNWLAKFAAVNQKFLTPKRLRSWSRYWLPMIGRRVVIIGADVVAVELAEFLARRGRRVHLLDEQHRIAPELGKKRRHEHMGRLDELRVTVNTGVLVERIDADAVIVRSDQHEHRIPCNSVIIAGRPEPAPELAKELQQAGFTVHCIGDSLAPGLIAGAAKTAAEALAQLGAEA